MIVESRPGPLRIDGSSGPIAHGPALPPDLVLIDHQAAGLNRDALRNLLAGFPDAPVIVILPPAPGTRMQRALQVTVATLLGPAEALRDASSPTPSPSRSQKIGSPEAHGGLAGWQIRRLNAYIDDHLGETIHVRDLAAITRLSLGHFAHTFKQAFGEPPLAHITRKRLERACDRMLAGDEPLSRIAQECGFCDQSHFTRHFHRAMGMAPQRWRRLHAPGPR